MDNLRNKLKKININGQLHFNEPMSAHTTFKTGGPADVFCSPADADELISVLKTADQYRTPALIIGGGANLLVSDSGIRGIVIDTDGLNIITADTDGMLKCGAGAVVDDAVDAALDAGLAGLDSFYGMPGTVGGALWMNARCYGTSISDLIVRADYLDSDRKLRRIVNSNMEFEYKKSVFQNHDWVITEAVFALKRGNKDTIRESMLSNRRDRENKGHYAGPSAGSVFKNNRAFGKPSGAIIDSLGLRETAIGGAVISKQHANIFMNTGSASSQDIYDLIKFVQQRVHEAYGFNLEPEVQIIGNFQ